MPEESERMELRGVRVHNLQGIDVEIPWGGWVSICGVSGSGKSSLAFDTLYAEGQRRYLESLSPGSRQFLEQWPAPEADHIDPLPPAIAVRQQARAMPPRMTVGTASEMAHYLRLLFAKIGTIFCPNCQRPVRQDTPQEVLTAIQTFPTGSKFQIVIPGELSADDAESPVWQSWIERGFTRAIINQDSVNLQTDPLPDLSQFQQFWIIVDRLTAAKSAEERIVESLELAFSVGEGRCIVLSESPEPTEESITLDGKSWQALRFSNRLACETCGMEFAKPEPRLFNPLSPAGACPICQGTGQVSEFDVEELVPDPESRLEDGAVACFREPALASQQSAWLEAVKQAGIPIDVPFAKLSAKQQRQLAEGEPQSGYEGLKSLLTGLAGTAKGNNLLETWWLTVDCPACLGQRLQPQALAVQVGGKNFGQVCSLTLQDFAVWLSELPVQLSASETALMATVLSELRTRWEALRDLGLADLALNLPVSSLSSGEAQRVALARTIGHQLVNSLYVFDEPSAGLHAADCGRVIDILKRIQEAGNTVVVVEHAEAFLHAAETLIDLGPGAGSAGGQVVFQGPPKDIIAADNSLTGQYLSGKLQVQRPFRPPVSETPWPTLALTDIRRFPFDGNSVEFRLNCLCVVTGLSGSGKTVLLEQVLYPAVRHALGHPVSRSVRQRFGALEGADATDDVLLIDQTPLTGSSRSNAVTYLNVFDDIRKLFAETPDANRQGFQLKDFSFNSPSGGRCPQCAGQGTVAVEMQFLADLHMVCPVCQGTRYRAEILSVRYRGLNISEVLNLTVADALPFFRTQPRIRKRLQLLKDVGLDYLPLGQPTGTLSGGESQRLKLASFLNETSRASTLFLFDQPTSGLHPADVQTLLNCFDHLLAVGHSVIIAEHNPHLIPQADWVIEL